MAFGGGLKPGRSVPGAPAYLGASAGGPAQAPGMGSTAGAMYHLGASASMNSMGGHHAPYQQTGHTSALGAPAGFRPSGGGSPRSPPAGLRTPHGGGGTPQYDPYGQAGGGYGQQYQGSAAGGGHGGQGYAAMHYTPDHNQNSSHNNSYHRSPYVEPRQHQNGMNTPLGFGYDNPGGGGRGSKSYALFDNEGTSSVKRSPQRSPRSTGVKHRPSTARPEGPKARGYGAFRPGGGKGEGIPTTPLSTSRVPSFDQSMSRLRTPAGASTPSGSKHLLSAQKRFAPTPDRMDPHYRQKGLHRQTHDSNRQLAADSVTVFGFPANVTADVLKEFEKCGPIVSKKITDCNWMHLKFSAEADAKKALGRDGMVLHDKHMIAVKPCTDIDFAGTVDVDTVSNSFTVLNSPAVRRRPLPNNATPSLGGPAKFVTPGSLQQQGWYDVMWEYILPDLLPGHRERSTTLLILAVILIVAVVLWSGA